MHSPALPLLSACVLLAGGCAAGGREAIVPAGATRLAPYSPAVRAGHLVFLSGVIGTRWGTRELASGGIAAETRQALANLRTVLAAADLAPRDVVKCTVFLASMADYEAMNAVYGEFFPTDPPARTAVAVAALPLGARVEIECIAARR